MLFSTPIFLFLFLPIVLFGYWLIGNRLRDLFLLCSSIFLYAWSDGRYVVLLFFSITVNYVFGVLIARYRGTLKVRAVVWFALAVNLVPLIWYKYATFIAENINLVLNLINAHHIQIPIQHLPLGISFITFQSIAYILDVYREETAPQTNIIKFGIFISLFPKIAAGPIIRYGEIAEDLQQRKINLELFSLGVKRFVIGLGKKILIADTIAKTTNQIFAIPHQDLSFGTAWLGVVCFTLQLYFDFSGYSDMAIGLGRMLGIRMNENFNYPYIARSLTDFWRRWHISLSTWFRDYLFMPLSYILMTDSIRNKIASGLYKKNYRSAFSVVVVFSLCGLWHGAGYNYIVWGLLHGAILGFESLWLGKFIKRWRPPFQHAYLLFVVMMSWVVFRSTSLQGTLLYFKSLAGFAIETSLQYHHSVYLNSELVVAVFAGVIGAMPISKLISDFSEQLKIQRYMFIGETLFICLVLLASFASLASSTFSPFIYQQF